MNPTKTHFEHNVGSFNSAEEYFSYIHQLVDGTIPTGFSKDEKKFLEMNANMIHNLHVEGNRVFRIKEDLTYLLFHTDLNKVDEYFLEVPYPVFYITNFGCLGIRTKEGMLIDAVYVMMHNVDNDSIREEIDAYIDRNKLSGVINRSDIKKHLSLYFVHEDITTSTNSIDSFNLSVLLKEGDIIKQLDEWSEYYFNNDFSKFYPILKKEDAFDLIKLVLNYILYINSEGVIIDKIYPKDRVSFKKNKKKIAKEIKKNVTRMPYFFVGKEIVLDNTEREIYEEGMVSSSNRRLTSHWRVRGHRRQQRVGTGLKEIKMIWIKPYIKGKDIGEIINKTYTVK